MPEKKFYVYIPGTTQPTVLSQADYDAKKDKLFEAYSDAKVVEMQDYKAGEDIGDSDFFINIPGTTEPTQISAKDFAEKQDKIYSAYPDVQVSRIKPVNYWGDKLGEIYDKEAALKAELEGLPAETNTAGLRNMDDEDLIAEAGRVTKEKAGLARRGQINKELDQLYRMREENPAWKQYWAGVNADIDNDSARIEKMQSDLRNENKDAARHSENANRLLMTGPQNMGLAAVEAMRSDPEYNSEMESLAAARLMLNDAKKAATAPSRYGGDDKGAWSDFWTGVKGGAPEALSAPQLVRAGLNMHLVDAIKKIQDTEGKDTSILDLVKEDRFADLDYLNAGEKELVKAFVKKAEVEGGRGDTISRSYQSGQSAVQSLGFMADFYLMGGVGEKAAEAVAGNLVKSAGRNELAKIGAESLYGLVKAAAMTPLMPSTYNNLMNNILQFDDAGGVDLSGKAVARAIGDVVIENISETIGSKPMDLIGLPLSKVKFPDWARAMRHSPVAAALKQAGYNGFIEEMVEEWTGNAIRVMTGVDKNALKDFATIDQQLITAGAFAPMSVVGLPMTMAQYISASKSLKKAGTSLETILNRIDDSVLSAEDKKAMLETSAYKTPEELAHHLAGVYQRIVESGGDASGAYKAVMDYVQADSQYKVMTGLFDEQRDIERGRRLTEMNTQMGNENWYHTGENGVSYVRSITGPDGNEMFVTAEDGNGLALVDRQGNKSFMSAEQLEAGINDGSLTDEGEQALFDYLDKQTDIKKKAEDQQRVELEQLENETELMRRSQPGTVLNIGTVENPVQGTVVQYTGGKFIVQGEDGQVHEYDEQEMANRLNIPLTPLTQEQQETADAEEIERQDRLRDRANTMVGRNIAPVLGREGDLELVMVHRPVVNSDGLRYQVDYTENGQVTLDFFTEDQLNELIALSEQTPAVDVAEQTESEQKDDTPRDFRGNPLPMRTNKQTGQQVVDGNALWNKDPEAWARWNDTNPNQRVGSKERLEYTITELGKEIDKDTKSVQKAALKGIDEDEMDKMESALAVKLDRRELLQSILNKYNLPAVAGPTIAGEQRKAAAEQVKQEQLAGFPGIQQRWNTTPKVNGSTDEIRLPNGESIPGHYVLTEAEAPTASHNPANGFAMTEGFPVDENGKTVNDRDYEHDKAAQTSVTEKAANYDQRALQTPVIVSPDGVVLSGNDRTMAGQLAAANNTDAEYTGYLSKYAGRYGFSAEQVAQFRHPRVVFVPDAQMPYNAATFAKFNAEEKKSQSKTEKAVKAGKTLNAEALGALASLVDRYDDINALYNDKAGVDELLNILLSAEVISQEQLAALRDGDTLSGTGMDLLESTLIGAALDEEAVRIAMADKSIRKSVVSAISQIITSNTLADFTLRAELTDAISLVANGKALGEIKFGESVQDYIRQQHLFMDDVVAEATVQMLADAINDRKTSFLKKVLSLYDRDAVESANGQMSLLTGDVPGREAILRNILEYLGYDTRIIYDTSEREREQRGTAEPAEPAAGPVAPAETGQAPATVQGGEGSEVTANGYGPVIKTYETKRGTVEVRTKVSEKDGVRKTSVVAIRNGNEVGTRDFVPLPSGYRIANEQLPDGTEVVGLIELRESTDGSGKTAATLIVKYDGVIDQAEVVLERTDTQPSNAQYDREEVAAILEQGNVGEYNLADYMTDEEVAEFMRRWEAFLPSNEALGEAYSRLDADLHSGDKKKKKAAQAEIDRLEMAQEEAHAPVQEFVDEMLAKYGQQIEDDAEADDESFDEDFDEEEIEDDGYTPVDEDEEPKPKKGKKGAKKGKEKKAEVKPYVVVGGASEATIAKQTYTQEEYEEFIYGHSTFSIFESKKTGERVQVYMIDDTHPIYHDHSVIVSRRLPGPNGKMSENGIYTGPQTETRTTTDYIIKYLKANKFKCIDEKKSHKNKYGFWVNPHNVIMNPIRIELPSVHKGWSNSQSASLAQNDKGKWVIGASFGTTTGGASSPVTNERRDGFDSKTEAVKRLLELAEGYLKNNFPASGKSKSYDQRDLENLIRALKTKTLPQAMLEEGVVESVMRIDLSDAGIEGTQGDLFGGEVVEEPVAEAPSVKEKPKKESKGKKKATKRKTEPGVNLFGEEVVEAPEDTDEAVEPKFTIEDEEGTPGNFHWVSERVCSNPQIITLPGADRLASVPKVALAEKDGKWYETTYVTADGGKGSAWGGVIPTFTSSYLPYNSREDALKKAVEYMRWLLDNPARKAAAYGQTFNETKGLIDYIVKMELPKEDAKKQETTDDALAYIKKALDNFAGNGNYARVVRTLEAYQDFFGEDVAQEIDTILSDLRKNGISKESKDEMVRRTAELYNRLVNPEAETEEPAQAESPAEPAAPAYGSQNTIITTEKYEELKKRMLEKLGQLNAGFDPEVFFIGAQMAAYHVEAGARKFVDFAQRMINDLGDAVRPYLKAIYNGARDLPGMEGFKPEMDYAADVEAIRPDWIGLSFDEWKKALKVGDMIGDERIVDIDYNTAGGRGMVTTEWETGRSTTTFEALYKQALGVEPVIEETPAQAEETKPVEAEAPKKAAVQQVDVNALFGAINDLARGKREEVKLSDYASDIQDARENTDTNPSDAQKEAGNYKKGHISIDGYDISLENPKGSVRSGKDANGNEWSVTMNNDYGYIRMTEGVDGDHIDVFLSDNPAQGNVFVVDQVKEDGSFDEHKVMYGFDSSDEASKAYLANYSPGWKGLGAITEVTKDEFRKWVDSSHRKTKPFAEYKSVSPVEGESLDEKASDTTGQTLGELGKYTHTKTGKEMTIVRLTGDRLTNDEFKQLKARAKELGGYYSSYGGAKGFLFDDEADAIKFNTINAPQNAEEQTDDETAADTTAVVSQAASVAVEAQSLAEAESADEQAAAEVITRIDDALEAIDDQLALLGYYKADTEDVKSFNEMYGYIKTAEKKAVKDAEKLARRLAFSLGIEVGRKKLAVANIAPAGGDISFTLPLNEGHELYVDIDLVPNADDDLYIGGVMGRKLSIMYRVENPSATGQARYVTSNAFAPYNVTYADLLNGIRDVAKDYLYKAPAAPVQEGPVDVLQVAKEQAEKSRKSKKDSVSSQQEGDAALGGLFADLYDAQDNEPVEEVNGPAPDERVKPTEMNGFKIGEKVQYTPSQGDRKPQTATIFDFEYDGRPVLDAGLAPILYEVVDWNQVSKIEVQEPVNDTQNGSSEQPQGVSADAGGPGEEAGQEGVRADRGGEGGREGDLHGSSRTLRPRYDDSVKRNTRNNRVAKGEVVYPKTNAARYKANIAAIRLMKELQDSGKTATKEQMSVLRQFTGWGGLGGYFNNEYSPEYRELKSLLSDEEMQMAANSINTAYYTPVEVIDAMWDIAKRLGFEGGNILEGSAGIGNILASMPKSMSERSEITAVELDQTTGGILSLLYPDANVMVKGFQDADIANGSVDLAITNVPFGNDIKVYDAKEKDISRKFGGGRIHDFCIAKNVRKLAPGGLGIFISTRGTLDSSSKALRQWLVNEGDADVIGAFRLNNATFEGTGATSDIIVVRKRVDGKVSPNAIDVTDTVISRREDYELDKREWNPKTRAYEIVTGKAAMEINTYFAEHPESMGGEMGFGFEHDDTYRPASSALWPSEKIDQNKRLTKWVKQFSSMQAEEQAVRTEAQTEAEDSNATKEGQLVVNSKGDICVSRSGKAIPIGVNSQKVKGYAKAQVLKDYDALKTAINEVLDYQLKNESDAGLKPLLDKLNRAYDTFARRYSRLNRNTAISFLRNDVDFPSIAAVEDYREKKSIDGKVKIEVKKTSIFSGRVLGAKRVPTPKDAKDGVIVSINQFGRIDIPFIANALNKDEDEVRQEILTTGLGFENPLTGGVEVEYEYLSGNVREKLEYAREHNADGKYDSNIKALEKVVPSDIPAHLIEFSLGSDWMPVELYTEYAKEKFGVNDNFKPFQLGGSWTISDNEWEMNVRTEQNRAAGVRSNVLNIDKRGHELMIAAMNNASVVFSRSYKDPVTGQNITETDKVATQAATAKMSEMRDDFKEWARAKMLEKPELAERIGKVYNDTFNAVVPKEIRDTFVPAHFEGMATKLNNGKELHLRLHQSKAVIRGTTEPLMLAHEVGTGKTFTLIATAMEMRRLGTAKKPMIVVQNATLGQFVSSAKELYPNAKILTISEADRTVEGRSAFYAKIKYNDWDMVVVPQSVFEMIPDSEERQRAFIQEKIDEKKFILEQAKQAGNSTAERQLKKELEDLEYEYQFGEKPPKKGKKDAKKEAKAVDNAIAKAKRQLDRKTDDVSNFDDMGIDALLVDEAHAYKHLGFSTAMQRGVKGVDATGSKKSAGVYLKTRAVFDKAGWKNVVFATGTPISNTAAEIWTFMKYLMPADVMRQNHIYYFDDFVRNFGNISQSLEFTTSGKFKENTRFASYTNLPELVRIWWSVCDTVRAEDAVAEGGEKLEDKQPKMENWTDADGNEHVNQARDIYLPQSGSLVDIMNAVRAKLEWYEGLSGKEKKENSHIPLTMFGIAKMAAIDPRLVDREAPDEPNSKTNQAVTETLKALKDSERYKGTAALFCDNFRRWDYDTNSGRRVEGFNIFEEIKRKLIDAGVPEDQIVIMKSGMNTAAKEKIFARVNSGEVRVIMGTTATLGTGVNIQERLFFEAHLDAPNRPMDYTQRNGRILRQGNLHKEWGIPVRVVRFGVEDSLDVTAYQRLSTKSKFINSVMDGKPLLANGMDNRVLEEAEEGEFDNPVAVLSGSQYALLKSQAERELRKLRNQKEQHRQDQIYIERTLKENTLRIDYDEKLIDEAKRNLDKVHAAFPDGTVKEIEIEGRKLKGLAQVGEVVKEKITDPLRAQIERRRNESGFTTEDKHYTMKFDGVPVDIKVSIDRTREYDDKTYSYKNVMRTRIEYSGPSVGIDAHYIMGGMNSIRDIPQEFADLFATGKYFQQAISNLENTIARLNGDNDLMMKRRGQPFADEDKLKKQEEVVKDYTEKMKAEMAEKEAKYAELAKNSTSSFSVDAVEVDEDEDDGETSAEYMDTEGNGFFSGIEDRREGEGAYDFAKRVVASVLEKYPALKGAVVTTDSALKLSEEKQARVSYGLYNRKTKKILIFAKENIDSADAIERTIFHEAIHMAIDKLGWHDDWKLINLFNYALVGSGYYSVDEYREVFSDLKARYEELGGKKYSDKAIREEMMAHEMSEFMENGIMGDFLDEVRANLPELAEGIDKVLNEIGYEPEKESERFDEEIYDEFRGDRIRGAQRRNAERRAVGDSGTGQVLRDGRTPEGRGDEGAVSDNAGEGGDLEEDSVSYEFVTDPATIKRLEDGDKETGYRNVVLNKDGSLGSPMASKLGRKGRKSVRTAPFTFDRWEQAEENPDMATEDGKINLGKPDKLGSVDGVDYNPYIHIRPSLINKQFTGAWKRDNLVFIETLYPTSELTSGYHAEKAVKSVGRHSWTNGDLILSRWDKPVRVVPWEAVADDWEKEFAETGVTFDIVPPGLLPVLASRGVRILPPKKAAGAPALRAYNEWRDNNPSGPGRGRNRVAVSSEQDAEYMAAVEAGDMEKAQKMVDEAAERAFKDSKVRGKDGNLIKVYHGTGSDFNVFERPDFIYNNGLGNGFYFTDDPKAAALYTMPGFSDNADKIDDTMIDILINEFNVDSDEAVEAVREGYTDIPHYDEAYDRAVQKLFPNPHVVSAYINIERPFVYDENTNLEGWEVSEKMDRDNLDGVIEKGYATRYPEVFGRIEEDMRPAANFGQYMVRNSSQIKSAEPVTYDDNGNVIPLSKRFNARNSDIRFRIGYHGSIADFDAFDLSHIGEGEGYASHGFGHYVALDRGVSVGYAWSNAFDYADRNGLISPEVADILRNDEFENDDELVARYDELLRGRQASAAAELEQAKREDADDTKLINGLQEDYDRWMAFRPLEEVFRGLRNIYTVEIPEDTGDNYIDEMKTLSKDGRRRIAAVIRDIDETKLDRTLHGPNWLPNGFKTLANVIEREQYAGLEIRQRLEDALGNTNQARKETSEILRKAGFVGMTYDGRTDGPCVVIFSNEDLRIVGHDRFRPAGVEMFISNAEAAVNSIQMEKATPQQWLKMIEGKGGLKAGEDKWIGLSEWLKAHEGKTKTLTKEEVLNYIGQSKIQIEEQEYSEGKGLEEQIDRKYPGFSSAFGIDNTYEAGEIWLKDLHKARELYERVTGDNADDLFETDLDDFAMELAQDVRTDRAINGTRLNYTTRGLDNKREIALVVPTIESWNQGDEIHFGDAGNGRAVAWARFGDARDSDGKNVLFIDEIQSKRHQEARDRGYSRKQTADEVIEEANTESKYRSLVQPMIDKYGIGVVNPDNFRGWREVTEEDRAVLEEAELLRQRVQELQAIETKGVPEAPFEKNWHELAMKRMLRYAAENGYDYVAWTTGDQQAERYNIGNVVNSIEVSRWGEDANGYYLDEELGKNARSVLIDVSNQDRTIELICDKNGQVVDGWSEYRGKNLSEIVGKELAKRLLSAEGKQKFGGENLRFGAEGMKGFYDDILPRFMNKYGKKWGVSVKDDLVALNGGAYIEAHMVPVSSEMKESVMQGQLMFRSGEQSEPSPVAYNESTGAKRLSASETARKFGVDIEFRPSSQMMFNGKPLAGRWMDGKMYVCLDHCRDNDDAVRTVLHEGVGHNGLRRLIGNDNMREFCLDLFRSLPKAVRNKIANDAVTKYGGNIVESVERFAANDVIREVGKEAMFESTEEWLAETSETIDYDEYRRNVWDIIRDALRRVLAKVGINVPLSIRDVKWLMVQSAMANHETDPLVEARRQVVANALGFTLKQQAEKYAAVQLSRNRIADQTLAPAARIYNKDVLYWLNRLRETWVDKDNAVHQLVNAIEKATGKAAKSFEDVRLALNQQSSKGLAAIEKFEREYWVPMQNAIRSLMDEKGCDLHDIERYVMIKHGLERNEVFAKRDAREFYRDLHDNAVKAIENSDKIDDLTKKALIAKEDAKLDKHLAAIDAGSDVKYLELRKQDYGGLTAMYSEYDPIEPFMEGVESEEEYQARVLQARHPKFTYMDEDGREQVDMAATEDAAQKEVNEFENGHDEAVKELWKRINGATKHTLKHQYDANMMSREQYNAVSGMFKYYVPLRGFADNTAEDMYDYYQSDQRNDFTPPLLKAKGRKTEAESPFGYIGSMASSGIAADMKNETKLALYYFVSNRADNDLVTISEVWYKNTGVDEFGRRIFTPVYPPFKEDLSGEDAKRAYEDWEKQMQDEAKAGFAFKGGRKLNLKGSVIHIDDSQKTSHVIKFKVGGRDMMMYINGNPRAAQAINNELNVEMSTDYQKVFGKILRWFSGINTSYNPEFWLSNAQRDALFAIMSVNVKEDGEYNEAFRKNFGSLLLRTLTPGAKGGAYSLKKKLDNGELGDERLDRLYKEFVENGGVTGYTTLKNNEEWELELRKYTGDQKKAMQAVKGAFEKVQGFGEAIEQMTRFAAYMTSRESGKDIKESVNDAKELTVNFNRKGSGKAISFKEAGRLRTKDGKKLTPLQKAFVVGASWLPVYGRRFIMFFNASTQGLNAMYRLFKKNPSKMGLWTAGYLALGVVQAALHALLDDDDDYLDIPDYERRNNLLLGGGGTYFKWALPQEARVFYAMGDMIVNHAMGREPHRSILTEVLASASDIAPLNPAGGISALAPSAVVPVVEVALNRDYKGSKIFNDLRYLSDEERKRTPKFQTAYQGTGRVYVLLSQFANWLSGGDYADAGWLNINPAAVEHILQGATGGAGTTLGKFYRGTVGQVLGEDFTVRNTPFLSRILTVNDDRYRNVHTTELFDYYKAEAEHTKKLINTYRKNGDDDKLDRIFESEDYEIMNIYDSYKSQFKYFNEELKVTTDRKDRKALMREQDAVRKEMIQEISNIK